MERVFVLNGLDCPNCAAKIEAAIGNLPCVHSSTVNLLTATLRTGHDAACHCDFPARVTGIVHTYEPHVGVVEQSATPERARAEANDRAALAKIALGGLTLLAAVIAEKFFPGGAALEWALFVAAYLILGGTVVSRAIKNIVRGRIFDENFLMSVATLGAFIVGDRTEAVAVMLFYQIGEAFQRAAVLRSKKSIADLMDIRPDSATVRRGDEWVVVSPQTVAVGEIIVVKPGEKIPLDGRVLHGEAMLDTRALTGESVPRKAKPGDTVLSGCINQNGVLNIEVGKAFGESTVAKIIDLVENAASKKAPTENFITTFSRYYTPVVVVCAALLAVLPPLMLGGAWADWIHRGLIFLVISCPCALVISIPLGFFGGIGGASRRGVLVKGGNYLEALNKLDIVVFDKTGTLTQGVFKVTALEAANGFTETALLQYAASAEVFSNHPVAVSIRNAYAQTVDEHLLQDYRELPGYGVRVGVNGQTVLVGNEKLMLNERIAYAASKRIGTQVYVAVAGVFAGCIVIADEVKSDSLATIAALKQAGVRKTVMLTGDNRQIGEAVARELGLDEVHAELLPAQKVEKLEMLEAQKRPGRKLAFVGDGINDAPVLARADIGIAMGGLGSDAAIEAADVVLMTDEPGKLLEALDVAKRTQRIVWENIYFALGVKGVFLALGAAGIAGMWEAVFADVGVAVLAVLNAMRVLKVAPRQPG